MFAELVWPVKEWYQHHDLNDCSSKTHACGEQLAEGGIERYKIARVNRSEPNNLPRKR